MPLTHAELLALMTSSEDEHLEFKEAKASFSQDKAIKYCCALANEGGGHLILGVTDKKPRMVVGSSAFPALESLRAELVKALHLRISVEVVDTPQGRVVHFGVPSHPAGLPLKFDKVYWCRQGEELTDMKPHQLQQIFEEIGPDFTAEFCPDATLDDLHSDAIQVLRERWADKSRDPRRLTQELSHLLEDAELLDEGQLTCAALILLGTRKALNRRLGQSEVIFEYRSSESPGPAQERIEFREGALLLLDPLWDLVNKRNDLQSWQNGLFMKQVATFNEGAVREAILKASHIATTAYMARFSSANTPVASELRVRGDSSRASRPKLSSISRPLVIVAFQKPSASVVWWNGVDRALIASWRPASSSPSRVRALMGPMTIRCSSRLMAKFRTCVSSAFLRLSGKNN
jgi:ATP-dependent DNA helicase RecG